MTVNAVASYFLSDTAYAWIREGARREHVGLSAWIEKHYPEWVEDAVCVRDGGLLELIEARAAEQDRRHSHSVVERGDVRKPPYRALAVYDGVVWKAMFGAWDRSARELRLSRDCVDALAAWTLREAVVQRRASSVRALAAQALELMGRRWVKANG